MLQWEWLWQLLFFLSVLIAYRDKQIYVIAQLQHKVEINQHSFKEGDNRRVKHRDYVYQVLQLFEKKINSVKECGNGNFL